MNGGRGRGMPNRGRGRGAYGMRSPQRRNNMGFRGGFYENGDQGGYEMRGMGIARGSIIPNRMHQQGGLIEDRVHDPTKVMLEAFKIEGVKIKETSEEQFLMPSNKKGDMEDQEKNKLKELVETEMENDDESGFEDINNQTLENKEEGNHFATKESDITLEEQLKSLMSESVGSKDVLPEVEEGGSDGMGVNEDVGGDKEELKEKEEEETKEIKVQGERRGGRRDRCVRSSFLLNWYSWGEHLRREW